MKSALSLSFLLIASPVLSQTAAVISTNEFVLDSAAEVETLPAPLTAAEIFAGGLEQGFGALGDEGAAFTAFYTANDFAPIWADGNSKTMLALVTALEQAPVHGLPLARYNIATLEQLWADANSPDTLAALEVAAAVSYATFAKDLAAGMLNPRSIDKEMNATRYVPETGDVLAGIAAASNATQHYRALGPASAEYAQMIELKREMETLVSSNGWGPLVPNGRTLRPGQSSDRVLALRVRLSRRGYEVTDLASTEYDDALIEVVKQFQTDFGLNADGLAGPQTMSSINAQPNGRLKQVIVNLERMRWMNYELGARHIYVNIPDYQASVMDNGQATLSFRVVVGKNRHQTAEFNDTMTHLIANPTWHVPKSIARAEYYPKLLADPTTLVRSNMRLIYSGTGQTVDSTLIDYSAYSSTDFPFAIQQLPGRGNALGRVKFMFPNKYNIYLHDTPSRSLFARDARAFSHGCVRVQKPLELAYELMSFQEADPQATFDAILATRQETQIDLQEPVPVHLVYRTAWIDSVGEPQFRHDIYGRDTLVMNALKNAGVTLVGVEG